MKGSGNPGDRAWFDRPLIFLLAAGFSCAVIAANAVARLESIKVATATTRYALPRLDPGSPTGYAGGRRVMVMPRAVDGCHWIMNAQRMAHEGLLRVRTMPDDNAPAGRPLHWSNFILWWMVGLGHIWQIITGLPLGAAIEDSAAWGLLPIHLLFAVLLPWSLRKVFGWFACALLTIGIGASYGFASLFFVGSPDHHGLVTGFLLMVSLFLAAGSITPGGRSWFVWAGIATGAALWISAATAIPALVGLGLGAALACFCRPGDYPWRVWGWSAGLSSLAFYLLEYFPGHMSLRLEVNHPLYALALVGAGEMLALLSGMRSGQGKANRNRQLATAALAAIAILAPLLMVFLAGSAVFSVKDAFLYGLHRDYIHEFKTLWSWVSLQHSEALLVAIPPLPLLVFPIARLLIAPIPASWKSALLVTTPMAVMLTGLALFQVRWLNTAASLWLGPLVVVAGCLVTVGPVVRLARWEKVAWVVFVLIFSLQMPQRIARDLIEARGKKPVPTSEDMVVVFARDVAYRLRALGGREPATVASGPSTTTWLMYFGGLKGLGTLYWENLAGLKSAARLYSATDEEVAREILARHQIAFVAILSPEPFTSEYARLLQGLPPGPPAKDTFAWGLASGEKVPGWAHDIPVPAPAEIDPSWAAVYDVRAAWGKRE